MRLGRLSACNSAPGDAPVNASSTTRYGAVAQTLHWIIAALIVAQFTLARLADGLPLGMRKLSLLARHKSFGMTVLMLAMRRLLWRAAQAAGPAGRA